MNLDPAIKRQLCYRPRYCPNPKCDAHPIDSFKGTKFYHCNGWKNTKVYPFKNKQYRCKLCRRSFSYTFFKLEYREQRFGLNGRIFNYLTCGVSNSEMSRRLH